VWSVTTRLGDASFGKAGKLAQGVSRCVKVWQVGLVASRWCGIRHGVFWQAWLVSARQDSVRLGLLGQVSNG
jgi:hypothetical protein